MSASTLTKTITAGILALTLAVTSVAPTPAQARISEEDTIAGILTLLLLGAAITDRNSRRDRADPVQVAPPVVQPRVESRRRDWRVLPAQCLRRVDNRRGEQVRFFAQRCLNNNYAHVDALPDRCHIRFRTDSGQRRQGFRPRCLRNAGFRTNRH